MPVTGSHSVSARRFDGWAAAPCPMFELSAAGPAARAHHLHHLAARAAQSEKKPRTPTDGRGALVV